MLYTIGHKDNYLRAIKDSHAGQVFKMGKRIDYAGGYVFSSEEDARRRIDEAYPGQGYAVFGLDESIENTEPAADGWWRTLSRDAKIIVLPTT